jgi:integrase/recombinase XerC
VAGSRRFEVAGAAHRVVAAGVPLLRPDVQMFEAMLEGWRQQQLSRNLAFGTVDPRLDLLRRFQDRSGEFPWQWTPQHLEEWSTDLRAVRGLASSTKRAYQLAIRSFLAYICEPLYGWDIEYENRFGTHPIQISHDWNSAKHIVDVEGRPQRRALTRTELQSLFDAADEMVEEIRRHGLKGAVARSG